MVALNGSVRVPEGVLFRELQGEAVILNLQTGQYLGLDEVGTRMWLLLTQHGEVAGAFAALLEEYDVEEERLRQDLATFLEKLADLQVMEVVAA